MARARAGRPPGGWPRPEKPWPARRPRSSSARERRRGMPMARPLARPAEAIRGSPSPVSHPTWAGAGVDSGLVPLFVAILAVVALMQAAFIVGLAMALRIANARMAELQATLDREIAKPIADLTRMADMAVRASELTLGHAQRMTGAVEDASLRIESVIGEVTRKLHAVDEDIEDAADEIEEDVIEPARDQLSGVAALFRGVQRAVEVWRDTAPPEARRRG